MIMEASELRMNNWVYIQQYKENKQIGVVYENGSFVTKNNEHSFSSIECATPIPLTEEWLRKAGFFKGKDDYFGTEPIFTQVICIYSHGENVFSLYRYNDAHVYVEYVHQLQNLYHALTGEELNFDLCQSSTTK